MPKNNKIFDDISKMASSTVATMLNVKNDLATYITHQIKAAIKNMDFVSKSDFQALKKSVEAMGKELNKYKPNVNEKKEAAPAKDKETKSKIKKKVIKK